MISLFGAFVKPFQFTPLREGRLATSESPGVGKISIHAPPRGATVAALTEDGDELISIHAPPRGATAPTPQLGGITIFQFTPLREGRRNQRGEAVRRVNISIHAPPRGATVSTGPKNITYQFQFTPLREGRRTSRTTGCKRHSFQFTPLREGRRGVSVHHGADGKISIHAPPRGATRTSSPL